MNREQELRYWINRLNKSKNVTQEDIELYNRFKDELKGITEERERIEKEIDNKLKEQVNHSKNCGDCQMMRPNRCSWDEGRISLLGEFKSKIRGGR